MPEKLFKIKADAEFFAIDLDDAFEKISNYLRKLSSNEPPEESIFVGGEIEIKEI